MALLAKLRPCGPWRVGPDSGDRLRVGRVLHSDALYSALTHAFIPLGELDAWLEATALHAEGAQVRLSSCFPFVATENGDALFLPPPDTHWPPPDSLRIRWESARFVTPGAVWQLLADKPLVEEHWVVDGVSECLLPVIRNLPVQSPFRVTVRSRAAVDRMGSGVEPHQTACLEFSKGSGIWVAFSFATAEAEARWTPALKGALKLIADSGLGGERTSGWGRFEQPEFAAGDLGVLLFGNRYRAPEEVTGHWLLSLFSPAADDRVDWAAGNYRVVARTGRVESAAGWGAAKRANQMIAEGGVLVAAMAPKGAARDVAPLGFAHPVYRAGFAMTLPIGKAKVQAPKPVVVDDKLLESMVKPDPVETSIGIEDTRGEHHVEAPPADEPELQVEASPPPPAVEQRAVVLAETRALVPTTAEPELQVEAAPPPAVPEPEQLAETRALAPTTVEPELEVEAATPPAVPEQGQPEDSHRSHAPTELPAAQLAFSLEPTEEQRVDPEPKEKEAE